jgi:hypothetical protein
VLIRAVFRDRALIIKTDNAELVHMSASSEEAFLLREFVMGGMTNVWFGMALTQFLNIVHHRMKSLANLISSLMRIQVTRGLLWRRISKLSGSVTLREGHFEPGGSHLVEYQWH